MQFKIEMTLVRNGWMVVIGRLDTYHPLQNAYGKEPSKVETFVFNSIEEVLRWLPGYLKDTYDAN